MNVHHCESNLIYRDLRRLYKKRERETLHIDFLDDCRYFGIIPKFLKINNRFLNKSFKSECRKLEEKILNKIIRNKKYLIHSLENKINSLRDKLYAAEEHETAVILENKIKSFAMRERNMYMNRQHKKLQFWTRNKPIKPLPPPLKEDFINHSKIKLNSHQKCVLQMGQKYIHDNNINLKDFIPKFENALYSIPENERSKVRNNVQNLIEKEIKRKPTDLADIKVIIDLKKNNEIICFNTDKTGRLVIFDKDEYTKTMIETIKKLETTECTKNPLKELERKINEITTDKAWKIDNRPINYNKAPIFPRIFAKLKDHKTPMTFRPIVNKREGHTYFLEKYMVNIYKKLLPHSNNAIFSTEEFIKKLKNFNFEPNIKIFSLDIINLYPSINNIEIRDFINTKLKTLNEFDNNMIDVLIRTNNLLLTESFFQFNNTIYKQKKGLPMGSPISGIIAEIKLRHLEEIILNIYKTDILFWVRYVDDILVIINNNKNENNILEKLNTLDNDIKFTIEIEKNNQINYLDVKLFKTKTEILTTVYRKPTKSNETIKSSCKTLYNFKISAFRTYINRAILICSNETLLNEEINNIKEIAMKNGYQTKLIDKLYNKRIEQLNNIPDAQKQKPKYTSAIPYAGKPTKKIIKEFEKFNIKIPIKPNSNINQKLNNCKDKIDPLKNSGIYKINYKTENNINGCYIGVTSRPINERIDEHIGDIGNERSTSALARLAKKENLRINFNDVERLAPYNNKSYGYKREAIEILTAENKCNDREHAQIDSRWKGMLIGQIKARRAKRRMKNTS